MVQTLGIEHRSKSQMSRMVKELDAEVVAFRNRPLDAGPYTYVWLDAMVQVVRDAGRIQNVAVVIATGTNATPDSVTVLDGARVSQSSDVLSSP